MPKNLEKPAKTSGAQLRALLDEGRNLVRNSFGLTARERDGALLLVALFVFGLIVRALRNF